MGKRWYVAKARIVLLAVEELLKQGFDAWAPRIEVGRIRRRGEIVVQTYSLFGAYVLVGMDIENVRWQKVNNTRGIDRLLPIHAEFPLPLPMGYVEGLQRLDESGKLSVRSAFASSLGYESGDEVRVADGVFGDHVGVFEKEVGEMSVVLFRLLGRDVRAKVPNCQIEPAPLRDGGVR